MRSVGKSTLVADFTTLVGPEVDDDRIDLLRASLVIAQTEYPNLDIEQQVARVDSIAAKIRKQLGAIGTGNKAAIFKYFSARQQSLCH